MRGHGFVHIISPEKMHPLTQIISFPLMSPVVKAFEGLKRDIANSTITAINPTILLVVDTDVSVLLFASLRETSHPVAFFSQTLSQLELWHSVIEKEAYAIVEMLKKW